MASSARCRVPVAARSPPEDVAKGFSGWSAEAVQFFKGLQADNTKACWSAHKAFCETAVRGPMVALPDELSGEFGPGRTVPGR